MLIRPLHILSVGLLLMLWGGRASASGDGVATDTVERRAAARALFDEGLAHADARRWGEAADRFERARALRPSAVITYNLSTALLRLGKLLRASELLREIVADEQATFMVKDAARARLGEIQRRLAYLTVSPPAAPTTGAVVVDGQRFDDARLGVAVPMDPIKHQLQLRDGDTVLEEKTILLSEGERRTFRFDLGQPAQPAALVKASLLESQPRTLASPLDASATAGDARKSRTWLWVLLGAVAAGVTTTAVVAMRDPAPGVPAGNVDTWQLGM